MIILFVAVFCLIESVLWYLNKNNRLFFLLLCLLMTSGCSSTKSYRLAKYSVKTAFDIAQDAGVFKERSFEFPKKWKGDTLAFYQGANKYLLINGDSSVRFTFTPSAKNMQDTTLYFLRTKLFKK